MYIPIHFPKMRSKNENSIKQFIKRVQKLNRVQELKRVQKLKRVSELKRVLGLPCDELRSSLLKIVLVQLSGEADLHPCFPKVAASSNIAIPNTSTAGFPV